MRAGLRAPGDERAVAALGKILATHESWALRILAAEALGRLGNAGAAGAGSHLADAAAKDAYALVRQAALEALASFDRSRAPGSLRSVWPPPIPSRASAKRRARWPGRLAACDPPSSALPRVLTLATLAGVP